MLRRVLLVVLVSGGLARAESLGVREVVERAVRQNPALASAAADIGIAAGAVRAAAGLDDFILDAGAQWTNSRSATVAGSPQQTPAADDVQLNLGVTKPLPSGGSIGISASGEWKRTEFLSGIDNPVSSTSVTYVPSVSLNFSHPLLAGAGRRVARAAQARAEAQKDVATLAQIQTATAVVRDVVSAYWEVVFAAADWEIEKAAAASARDQLERTEANIRVGKLPPSASAEVKVTIALREEAALVSERVLLDRALDLRELAGMDIGADPSITPTDALEVVTHTPSIAAALSGARERNPDLLVAKAREVASIVEVDAADTRPTLNFSVSGGPSAVSDDAGDALSQMGKFKTYNLLASLTFRDALGRDAARGALQSARAGVDKAKVSTSQVQRQVDASVARVVAALSEAAQRVAVMEPAIAQANLDLDGERARFEVGRATNFDVLRRQQELTDTQLRLARAKTDYLQAEAALAALTGDILDRFGVSVFGTKGPTPAP